MMTGKTVISFTSNVVVLRRLANYGRILANDHNERLQPQQLEQMMKYLQEIVPYVIIVDKYSNDTHFREELKKSNKKYLVLGYVRLLTSWVDKATPGCRAFWSLSICGVMRNWGH